MTGAIGTSLAMAARPVFCVFAGGINFGDNGIHGSGETDGETVAVEVLTMGVAVAVVVLLLLETGGTNADPDVAPRSVVGHNVEGSTVDVAATLEASTVIRSMATSLS